MMKRKKILTSFVIIFLAVTAGTALSSDFMWGNLVLDRTMDKMKQENVNAVIYPHWLHRIWFRCKVCHLDIVKDKKGSNEIDMKKIKEGKVCGTCHNGKLAFGVENNCKRCHSLKEDGSVEGTQYSPDVVQKEEYNKIADRFGSGWDAAKLEEDKFPVDKFGFIDWVKLLQTGAVEPIHSLNPKDQDLRRDSGIRFNVLSDFEDDVLFSHKKHTFWMKCEMCHDKIFKPEVGANKVRMKEMVVNQNFCIHCHGKVSFPAASCISCHKEEKGKPVTAEGETEIIDRHEKKDAEIIIEK